MVYAPTLWTDGVTPVNAANLNKLEQGLAAAVGIPADVVVPAASLLIRNRFGAGDANFGFKLQGDGRMDWGPGGAAAPDTGLWRASPGMLYTPGGLTLAGQLSLGGLVWMESASFLTHWQAAAGTQVFHFRALGDGNNRFGLYNDGQMTWGGGAAGFDTNLYRRSAGDLKTDGVFRAGASIVVEANAHTGSEKLYFSDLLDTNLYRAGVGILKTDGGFVVGGELNTKNINMNQGYLYSGAFPVGYAFLISRAAGDADNRFTLSNDGHMYWGDGVTGPDVGLYRSGASSLYVDGQFAVSGQIIGMANTPQQIAITSDGKLKFGNLLDTNLYRDRADVLITDDNLWARESLGTEGLYYAQATATTQMVFEAYLEPYGGGDLFQIYADGKMRWGGGVTAPDTNLYRHFAGGLITDGYFTAKQQVCADYQNANQAVLGQYGGKAGVSFGYPIDTGLYRESAGVLKANGTFQSVADVYSQMGGFTQIRVGNSNGRPTIEFGLAMDTSLARESAGVLSINSKPILRQVAGYVNGAGAIIVGAGYSVSKTGTGQYTVTFTTAFFSPPAVVVSAVKNGMIFCAVAPGYNASSFSVIIRGTGGAVEDCDWTFNASGDK